MTNEPPLSNPEAGPEPGPKPGPKGVAPAKAPARRRLLPLAAALVIVLLLALGLWLAYRPAPAQLQGMVDAREIRITSKVTGRIAAFHAEEGQFVQAGALLYTLDSPEVEARRQQAGGALTAAEAMAGMAAEGAAPLGQTTYARMQRLFDEGVVAAQQRDEARANAVSSAEAARAARAQYDLALGGARRQERQAAGGQVEQARGAVAEVDAAARETQVTAPVAGEIGRRLAQPGELVPQGFPVFMLTEVTHPWVTLNVREDAFGGLRQGATLRGRIPALGDQAATFRVAYLAPAGDYATWRATRQSGGFDVRSFEVRVVPTAPIDGLRPGMTVLFDWPQ